MTSDVPNSAVKVPIGFPHELYDWLRTTAFRRHVPMAALVREALAEYRERIEPQLSLSLLEGAESDSRRTPR